jgi:two-component system, OmpR family, sensor kinase
MTRRRRTLGAHLAWLVAISTTLCLLAFTATAALVIWLGEDDEHDEEPTAPIEQNPVTEVLEQVGIAAAVAAPVGIGLAVLGARWAARRATARIDGLVANARQMRVDNLRERIAVSSRDDEFDQLATALNAMFDRIADGVGTQRRFAADVSHELRTPLTVAINELEVARRRPRSADDWSAVADSTLTSLRQLADLVEALLHSARSGGFDLAVAAIDLDAAAATALAPWRAVAAGRQLSVDAQLHSGVDVAIDPRALAIVIGNLVANAIAHSPAGATVRVRAVADGSAARIEVDDAGPGVADADRDRIFIAFERGDRGVNEVTAGVGLGLAIARRLIEASHGRIVVERSDLGGARFVVTVPTVAETITE